VNGPDDLRVGDAERTRVTEALHDHFAEGRLTRDELDERLDATLAAKTYGDLRRVTQDLPAEAPATAEASAAGWSGPTPPVQWRRPRLPFVGLVVAAFLIVAALTGGIGWALLGVLKVVLVAWLVLTLVGMMHIRRWHRHGRRRHGPYGPYGPWRGYSDPWRGRRHPGIYRSRGRRRW
jgi:hypothetical protein